MAARTRLLGLAAVALAVPGAAAADVTDSEILGERRWQVEDLQLRTSYLDQRGRGFQSQDGGTPGSEQMLVLQPSALITLRQSERVVHTIALPLDAISAASPDAVDATTSASRRNIAGDLDVRTSIELSEHDTLTTRAVIHAEEWLGGALVGAGYKRDLADDNATVSVNGSFGFDVFDDHDHFGTYLGKTGRATASLSVAGSQLLSPTTIADASYGITYQHGTLRTGWNAVPVDNGTLTDEIFPRGRLRHALTAGLAQHLPLTRTTAKARYRFYADDFGVRAHSVAASLYQYVVGWLYIRGSYRYHDQTGVDFFTTAIPVGFDEDATLRTADSDLAPLSAHELSVSLATVRDRGPLGKWSISAELFRYQRSNDLRITAFALGLGRMM